MAYTLIKDIIPIIEKGARSGLKLRKTTGVTIHMTDNWGKGAGAKAHANYLKNSGKYSQASWHYCIDDTYATQSIPEDETAWHAGDSRDGTGNRETIAIEICLNPESDLSKACDNAVELTVDILKRHGLKPSCVYRHYDWSGKKCPSQIIDGKPYTWEVFKSKVNDLYNKNNTSSICVGSIVYFDGKSNCYRNSAGEGKGSIPPAGTYTVTHYNKNSKCPIHIGDYGWVPAINCSLNVKDITTIAKEVIAGKWGNGETRKQKLQAAGYNYSQVQAKVNELLK